MNECSGEILLATTKSGSTVAAFTQLFGSQWGRSLREVVGPGADGPSLLSVEGFISSEGISNKRKQFLFLNGRFVKNSSLDKAVNEVLKRKSLMCKPTPVRAAGWDRDNQESPTKTTAMYAVYCLRVSCPASEFVASQEPGRTVVDFKDWAAVRGILEECLTRFLQSNSLLNVSAAAALAMAESGRAEVRFLRLELRGATKWPTID